MVTSTRRTGRAVPPAVAVAFYGRTNQRGPQDPSVDAEQYRQCLAAVADRGVISQFYDETFLTTRRWSGRLLRPARPGFDVLTAENRARISCDASVALADRDPAGENSVCSHYACNGRLGDVMSGVTRGVAEEVRCVRCE